MQIKTINDYYENVRELWPRLPEKDIKRILNFGFKSLYLHNSYGGDTFIKDNDFKNRYVEHSMEFMRKSIPDGDNLCHMVFAEQRILPMCAVAEQMNIYSFCDNMDALREQKLFTHFWGHKNLLKSENLAKIQGF